jgi:polygalacturonase
MTKDLLTILSFIIFSVTMQAQDASSVVDWSRASAIAATVRPLQFPSLEISIVDRGAQGNGNDDCTAAIARAIEECSRKGGGTVKVPAGRYRTGAIRLKSNIRLHLEKGSTLIFSNDPTKYLPMVFTRWEGVELMNYAPLIYAYGERNVAVTGEGTLDGNASAGDWWKWKGLSAYGWNRNEPSQKKAREQLMKMAEENIPTEQRMFGEGHFLRPNFIQFYRCSAVEVSGVTILNSPMWFIHPVLCDTVMIDGVKVIGHGPNNDGCNPESSTNVVIRNCLFDTGDDCIAIKSGRNADGRRLNIPSKDILIQNCTMKDGHGGVVIGSEISGGVTNVFIEECTMDSPNLERALRFKTNSVRGGVISNIFARNITVGEVSEAVVLVDFNYEEGDAGAFTPVMKGLSLKNITAKKGKYGFFLKGYERSPVSDITVQDCTFNGITSGNILEFTKNVSFSNVTVNGSTLASPK